MVLIAVGLVACASPAARQVTWPSGFLLDYAAVLQVQVREERMEVETANQALERYADGLHQHYCSMTPIKPMPVTAPVAAYTERERVRLSLAPEVAYRLSQVLEVTQAANHCFAVALGSSSGTGGGVSGHSGVLLTPGLGRGYAYDTGTGLILVPTPGGGTSAIIDLRGGGE